jgi:hypothetical protein
MSADRFIIDTLSHWVHEIDGPPPGIPAHIPPSFDQELPWLCEWNGVTPLVMASLDRLALPPRLSRITLERIRALSRASQSLTRVLTRTARELNDRFAKAGIAAMWIDGVRVANTVYPQKYLRPVEHIDLMVREQDWESTVDILERASFRRPSGAPLIRTAGDALDYHQYVVPCVMENERGDRLIVRFRVFDMGQPEREELAWERAATHEGVVHLGDEDQLIRSCCTFAMTRLARLQYAADIGRILHCHGDELDWEYIIARLRARSSYNAVFFTMSYVAELFGTPDWTIHLPRPAAWRRRFFEFMWYPTGGGVTPGDRAPKHRMRFHLLETGTPREKTRFLRRILFPRRRWVESTFGHPARPWDAVRFVHATVKSRTRLI